MPAASVLTAPKLPRDFICLIGNLALQGAVTSWSQHARCVEEMRESD